MSNATTRDRFHTLDSARNDLDSYDLWVWGPRASWEGWVRYAYLHATETFTPRSNPPDYSVPCWTWDEEATLAAYLLSCGEPVEEYGITDALVNTDGTGPSPEVLALCSWELYPHEKIMEIPHALQEHINTTAERWTLHIADLCDLDKIPIDLNRWWVLYYPEIRRAAVLHDTTPSIITWTDASTPVRALARVLSNTARA